jgi:diguanylate cyclase (GGDEF)-like protein
MNNPLEGRERRSRDDAIKGEGEEIADRTADNLLRHLATSQALDGVAEYQAVIQALGSEIRRSNRTQRSFAVLLFGLNGMAQINERYGLETGNRALFRLASMFDHFCRSMDTAVRYQDGGFLIVLPETGLKGADQVALRIREGLANDREEPLISVSVGIAVYPENGKVVRDLLQSADQAFTKMRHQKRRTDPYSNSSGARVRHASYIL